MWGEKGAAFSPHILGDRAELVSGTREAKVLPFKRPRMSINKAEEEK